MIQSYRNLQKKSLKFFNNRFLMKIIIIKTIFTLDFYYNINRYHLFYVFLPFFHKITCYEN